MLAASSISHWCLINHITTSLLQPFKYLFDRAFSCRAVVEAALLNSITPSTQLPKKYACCVWGTLAATRFHSTDGRGIPSRRFESRCDGIHIGTVVALQHILCLRFRTTFGSATHPIGSPISSAVIVDCTRAFCFSDKWPSTGSPLFINLPLRLGSALNFTAISTAAPSARRAHE